MCPFIIHVKDVQADENYGYRAIANLLGFEEDGWAQIRRDMLQEINAYAHLYLGVYRSAECVKEIRQSLNHFEGGAPYAKWMVMPDMRYLIASHYNVVFILLSLHQCLTFLPLRTEPVPQTAHRSISVEFLNNNHFVGVSNIFRKSLKSHAHFHTSDSKNDFQLLMNGMAVARNNSRCIRICLAVMLMDVQLKLSKFWLCCNI